MPFKNSRLWAAAQPFVAKTRYFLRTPIGLLSAWSDDQCARLGAAVAFYAIFSLAPLLAIAVMIAGLAFGVEAARGQIVNEVGTLVGHSGTTALQSMLNSSLVSEGKKWSSALIGVVTLFIGATGVFVELRYALDSINQQAKEIQHGLSWFVRARLMSFALVLAVGFVALASLALSAALSAFADWLSAMMPVLAILARALDALLSLAIIGSLFMLLLRWLPSVQPRRVALWPGALLSAALFVVGKYLVGFYLGRAAVTDAYGAAASLVIILIWVYYCTQVLLVGAEYNKLRAERECERQQEKSNAPLT
jgi:membrane protein